MDRQLKDLIQSDVKRYYSGGGVLRLCGNS